MKTNSRHTYIMIGLALLILAGVFAAIGFSQPEIYVSKVTTEATAEAKAKSSSTTKLTSSKKAENSTVKEVSYPLNINTATLEELMTIDGLGEKKASAIIEYRNYLGKYTSVEQILEIEGFGDATYEAVAGYLTV